MTGVVPRRTPAAKARQVGSRVRPARDDELGARGTGAVPRRSCRSSAHGESACESARQGRARLASTRYWCGTTARSWPPSRRAHTSSTSRLVSPPARQDELGARAVLVRYHGALGRSSAHGELARESRLVGTSTITSSAREHAVLVWYRTGSARPVLVWYRGALLVATQPTAPRPKHGWRRDRSLSLSPRAGEIPRVKKWPSWYRVSTVPAWYRTDTTPVRHHASTASVSYRCGT